MAFLYDKVVSTVSRPPDERTDGMIEQILPWFRKKSELFKSQKTGKHFSFSRISFLLTRQNVIIMATYLLDCNVTVLVLSKLKKINATAPQLQRNVLKYFAIFKNVAHSLELGETPSNSASHQAPNYVQRS